MIFICIIIKLFVIMDGLYNCILFFWVLGVWCCLWVFLFYIIFKENEILKKIGSLWLKMSGWINVC